MPKFNIKRLPAPAILPSPADALATEQEPEVSRLSVLLADRLASTASSASDEAPDSPAAARRTASTTVLYDLFDIQMEARADETVLLGDPAEEELHHHAIRAFLDDDCRPDTPLETLLNAVVESNDARAPRRPRRRPGGSHYAHLNPGRRGSHQRAPPRLVVRSESMHVPSLLSPSVRGMLSPVKRRASHSAHTTQALTMSSSIGSLLDKTLEHAAIPVTPPPGADLGPASPTVGVSPISPPPKSPMSDAPPTDLPTRQGLEGRPIIERFAIQRCLERFEKVAPLLTSAAIARLRERRALGLAVAPFAARILESKAPVGEARSDADRIVQLGLEDDDPARLASIERITHRIRHDSTPAVRIQAIQDLDRADWERDGDWIRGLLEGVVTNDLEPRARFEAAILLLERSQLVELAAPEIIEQLLTLDSADQQQRAFQVLGEVRGSDQLRQGIGQLVLEVGPQPASASVLHELEAALCRLGVSDDEMIVELCARVDAPAVASRLRAVDALVYVAPTSPLAIKALCRFFVRDPHELVAERARAVLHDLVYEAMRPDIALELVDLLADIPDLPALTDVMKTRTCGFLSENILTFGLGYHHDLCDFFLGRLEDPVAVVRTSAVRALSRVQARSLDVEMALVRKAGDPNARVRLAVVEYLQSLPKKNEYVRRALRELQTDSDEQVRTAAISASKSISSLSSIIRATVMLQRATRPIGNAAESTQMVAVFALLGALGNPDRLIKNAAQRSLTLWGKQGMPLARILAERAIAEDWPRRAATAVRCNLCTEQQILTALREKLSASDAEGRVACLRAMISLPSSNGKVQFVEQVLPFENDTLVRYNMMRLYFEKGGRAEGIVERARTLVLDPPKKDVTHRDRAEFAVILDQCGLATDKIVDFMAATVRVADRDREYAESKLVLLDGMTQIETISHPSVLDSLTALLWGGVPDQCILALRLLDRVHQAMLKKDPYARPLEETHERLRAAAVQVVSRQRIASRIDLLECLASLSLVDPIVVEFVASKIFDSRTSWRSQSVRTLKAMGVLRHSSPHFSIKALGSAFSLVADESKQVRDVAMEVLASEPLSAEGSTQLAQSPLVGDERAQVRSKVVRLLGRVGQPIDAVFDVLLRVLSEDQQDSLRSDACRALHSLDLQDRALSELGKEFHRLRQLRTKYVAGAAGLQAAQGTLRTMQFFKKERLHPFARTLSPALFAQDPAAAAAAAAAGVAPGDDVAGRESTFALNANMRSLRQAELAALENARVRTSRSLGELLNGDDFAVELLLGGLQDIAPAVRHQCALSLGMLCAATQFRPAVVQQLLDLLELETQQVKYDRDRRSGTASGLSPLEMRGMHWIESHTFSVRLGVVEALSRMGLHETPSRLLSIVHQQLLDEKFFVRLSVLRHLRGLGFTSEAICSEAVQLLNDKDDDVRAEAASLFLAHMQTSDYGILSARVIALLDDTAPVARQAVSEGLVAASRRPAGDALVGNQGLLRGLLAWIRQETNPRTLTASLRALARFKIALDATALDQVAVIATSSQHPSVRLAAVECLRWGGLRARTTAPPKVVAPGGEARPAASGPGGETPAPATPATLAPESAVKTPTSSRAAPGTPGSALLSSRAAPGTPGSALLSARTTLRSTSFSSLPTPKPRLSKTPGKDGGQASATLQTLPMRRPVSASGSALEQRVVMSALLKVLAGDAEEGIRLLAIKTLYAFVVAQRQSQLKSRFVKQLSMKGTMDTMLEVMQADTSLDVVRMAIDFALTALGVPKETIVKIMLGRCKAKDAAGRVIGVQMLASGSLLLSDGTEPYVDNVIHSLSDALRDPYAQVRAVAAIGLGRWGVHKEEVLVALMALVGSGDRALVLRAIESMGSMKLGEGKDEEGEELDEDATEEAAAATPPAAVGTGKRGWSALRK